jgi:ectoine hydroxylase-related dioxygenase (phytanoyl-CoA dioxygenase family)
LISDNRLQPAVFLPKAGDVLLWHANLIHAGSPRRDLGLSRRAVVLHYFAKGAVCYHDLSGTLTPTERLK